MAADQHFRRKGALILAPSSLPHAYAAAVSNSNWPPGRQAQLRGALRVYRYVDLLPSAAERCDRILDRR